MCANHFFSSLNVVIILTEKAKINKGLKGIKLFKNYLNYMSISAVTGANYEKTFIYLYIH